MYPPSGIYSDNYASDMAIIRTKFQWALLAGLLVLLLALPFFPFMSSYVLRVITNVAILIIAVQGINIVTGYCGQITLGQSAFMLLGGYVSGILSSEVLTPLLAPSGLAWLSFWISVPVAVLCTVVVGTFFALPSARVKELYLALTTLAAHFIITWGCRNIPPMFDKPEWGSSGLRVTHPAIGKLVFDSEISFYFLAIAFCIAATYVAKSIARSGLGRAFVAVRDNDIAAEVIGVNTLRYKLIAFAICSAYAGVAGSLLAHHMGWIGPESQTLTHTVWYVGMLIVGGLGSVVGPIFGVITLVLLGQGTVLLAPILVGTLTFLPVGAEAGMLITAFGLVIALFLVFEPRGLAHSWGILKSSTRVWPYAY